MGRFKKGDKVRRINDNFGLLKVGDEVVIDHFAGSTVRVAGDPNYYMQSCFELVDPEPKWVPKVGDRVRVEWGGGWDGEADVFKVEDGLGYVKMLTGESAGQDGGFLLRCLKPILAPTALNIQAGRYYRTRDGRKVGPMIAYEGFLATGGMHYAMDGECCYCGKSKRYPSPQSDIIAEWIDEPATPATAEPAKFKVGDIVTRSDGFSSDQRLRITEVVSDDDYTAEWLIGGPGSTHKWRAYEFELVSRPTTAIVALIANGTPVPSATPKVHASQEAATAEADRLAHLHKGQKFGVFVLTDTKEVAKTYEHEWQRLAAGGEKIQAIKAIRALTGFGLKASKDGIEDWLDRYVRRAA